MKKYLLGIALYSAITNAFGMTSEFDLAGATDKSGLTAHRYTAKIMPSSWGIAGVMTDYRTPLGQKQSYGGMIVSNVDNESYSVIGQLGMASTDSKNFLIGDITATKKLNQNASISMGLFGDLLEGTKALANNIDLMGVVASAELSNDRVGFVGGVKEILFSDKNVREEFFVKPWIVVYPGISTYITWRDYTNSMPNRPFYFSPETYNRTGVGIRFRKSFENVRVSGFVEQTEIKTPTSREPAFAWKVQAERPLSQNLRGILSFGRDVGAISGFTYEYFNATLRYNF